MHITPSLPETGEDFAACALPKRYVELINGGNAPGSSRSTGGLRGGLYARLWPKAEVDPDVANGCKGQRSACHRNLANDRRSA